MLIPMLKAVVKMLEDSKEPKVVCAKNVLTEIITSQDPIKLMEDEDKRNLSLLNEHKVDNDLDKEARAAQEELTA